MRTLGNILWFVMGGGIMGISWMVLGFLAMCSVIGYPWAKACFTIGKFSFSPFGKEVISRGLLTNDRGKKTYLGTGWMGTGWLEKIGNIIWFITGGLVLATGHFVTGLSNLVTVIGIPFAIQHFKLASLALFPVGKNIITVEMGKKIRSDLDELRKASSDWDV